MICHTVKPTGIEAVDNINNRNHCVNNNSITEGVKIIGQ